MKKLLKDLGKHTLTILVYIILPVVIIFCPLTILFISKDIWDVVEVSVGAVSVTGENAYKYQPIIWCIIIIAILVVYFFVRKVNKNKVFINQNIYANYPIWVYYIAYYILGYGKIRLALKPYYISIKLILNGMFDIVDEIPPIDEKCEIKVDYSKFTGSNNLLECNIIISDTYKIQESQIPLNKRDVDTIKIDRINIDEGKRVFCQKLIDEVNVAFGKITNSNTVINLYTTVNPIHFNRIVSDVLKKGGRDTYMIRLFQQEKTGNREFVKSKEINIG